MSAGTVAGGDRIELRGLRLLGVCGSGPEERSRPQPLDVDLDVAVDLAPAGVTDALADTVDYGSVCATVAEAVAAGPASLLEHLAQRVADAVLATDARILSVTITVRKLRPPVPHLLDTAGVRITRGGAGAAGGG
ncbi:MAG: dihydroneopterin aldolase [Acidimicrobiales bacterium]